MTLTASRPAARLARTLFPGQFLTRSHGRAARWGTALAAAGATLAVTGTPALAREMFRRLHGDQFLTGMRRLSWYLRRGWPGIDISQDPVPVFYQELAPRELAALRRFLSRRAARLAPDVLQGELCLISASAALAAFGTPDYPRCLQLFRQDAAAALQGALDAAPVPPASQPPAAGTPIQQQFSRPGAEQALRDTLALLEQNGIRAFVLSGTFLGAVREKAILEHDYDIDLGVIAEETDLERLEAVLHGSPPFRCIASACQTRLERDGSGRLARRDLPVLYKLRHANGTVADIFLHYREDGLLWHGSSQYRWDNADFGLASYPLAGIEVQGPDDAGRYLTENYGNWQVPKRDFHCGSDTPNLQLLPNPLSLAQALWQLRLSAGSPRRQALLAQMQRAGHITPAADGGWQIPADLFAP
ncbi:MULTISPECIES: hypothetical protein [unclassified Leisingera]|uniref:hypothetical protein n=1 Tax=unclassified Leisingera TaxID=2614906 RepID=UPI00031E0424|nr:MULTISPECIES: hypothetical protein [unclassified Leisingera]KIC18756.1 hypothetical protein RA21_04150 [Leisingera sp. ANG-DT]KIC23990.1 hypothetical protein RA23_12615 [Leisingera sp. ANG-S3]KIC25811.1 hypothetical protein RA24_19450 [Leisingera sp. ANG-M6]KIC28718.1 hypothetical protein RA25_21140 [Leisingera sp. ANG-S5]KIC52615.1 hypothetical protein RA22_15165 [Leisingera sp. ANG-S]